MRSERPDVSVRAQSHVVGVALLFGLTAVALGTLTVGVGTVVDSQASNADAHRVADGMDETFRAVDRGGRYSQRLSFAEGRLATTDRTLRILENGTVVETQEIGALVFTANDRRVAAVAGAITSQQGSSSWLVSEPSITGSERNGVLVVGAPALNAGHVSIGGTGGVTATVRIDPSHTEHDLGTGTFSIAIETATPGPFERYFERQNATTDRRTFAGDSTTSVVAHYPGTRQGYLVVHDLALEVTNG